MIIRYHTNGNILLNVVIHILSNSKQLLADLLLVLLFLKISIPC